MDRNEGIVRWSPNTTRGSFMVFNLNNRAVHLYEATGHAQPGKFEYSKIGKHSEVPALFTYDWSPVFQGLVAVGTSQGEVHLLRVDDHSNDSLTLPLKLQRPCQSVAFNTTGLLAVGLDRVRNDSCLQIWDVNQRLADWDPKNKGWNVPNMNIEPKKKLEGSTSITSIRFFEDQPQTLVVGVKNQSVRIHDLRDPSSSVVNFQTRCNNNIAIDYTDSNYFASSSLDDPGMVIWDKRASSQASASRMYNESVIQEEVPWGGVLRLKRVIEGTEKEVNIKQLRYSREERGALGVLSTAGQLRILQTKKEFVELGSADDVTGSPEMLEIRKSYELEYPYSDPAHQRKQDQRIVSFDWLNLGTSQLQARVVALRANGDFEILQMPADTAGQLSQLMPWQPPHRQDESYMTLMDFADPSEREKVLGPLFATAAKAAVPIFGPNKFASASIKNVLNAAIKKSLHSELDPIVDLLAPTDSAIEPFKEEMTQLRKSSKVAKGKIADSKISSIEFDAPNKVYSSRELHDRSHYSTFRGFSTSTPSSNLPSHVMLNRAEDGYLFDCRKNQFMVANDNWLRDVWEWIEGAEEATDDDGMVSLPLDMSYMGVYTVWMNLLGEKSQSRLIDSTVIPDATQWERLIASLNKKAGRPHFNSIETTKPHHRQLCLAICGLSKSSNEFEQELMDLEEQGKHTKAAAWALFEGFPERAIQILKNGGTDLLFVAMALDIKLKSTASLELNTNEWATALENHPQMAEDPYLRAIYGYITAGDWQVIADESSLPLRDRVGVALRHFDDDKLTNWLSTQMEEATVNGDLEGIVLAGITDNMVDILAKYIEKFMDYQTPILIMSFCYPRYIDDIRCDAWRKNYKGFLQRHKKFIRRVMFEQQSTIKSRKRDGTPVIKPPPRQVTIRCLNCDAQSANDLGNSGAGSSTSAGPSSITPDTRNPLTASSTIAGLCCPRCGSHLPRCAVCMEIVGMPRSDRPEQSADVTVRRMADFPTFCLKCKHVMHMDHSIAWFSRHMECPVPECQCQCNDKGIEHAKLG